MNREVTYYLLDVEVAVQGPAALLNQLDLVYGHMRTRPPDSPGSVRVEVVVARQPDGQYRVESPWGSSETDEEGLFGILLFLLQNHAVRMSQDYILVHGAALQMGEKGCILSAASSVGKTTLTYELVRQGARFMSDEIAALPVNGTGITAFPRAIGLRPASLRVFGLTGPPPGSLEVRSGELKYFVDPGSFVGHSALDCIVFLTPREDPDVPKKKSLAQLEISLVAVPGGFSGRVKTLPGVEEVSELTDRPHPTLRIAYRPGMRIVKALDELALQCGAAICGHHRGATLPIDYHADPTSQPLSSREGLERLVGSILNTDTLAKAHARVAQFALLAKIAGSAEFHRVTPGRLQATCELVRALCYGPP